jgi:hypothetical protein
MLANTMRRSLPIWNDDWERADPLKGRRGWTKRDYANIGVAACLFLTTVGLLVPAVPRAREADARTQVVDKMREINLKLE